MNEWYRADISKKNEKDAGACDKADFRCLQQFVALKQLISITY
jgi:hypothetical protein